MEVVCFYKEGAKKSFKLNKKDYGKLSEHIGKIPSVLVTPYDTDIIREGSEARRRFFDSILSQIDQEYLSALIKYNLNLKQRNSALKKFSIRGKVDYELLETYDQLLIKFGDQIYLKRKAFIRDYLQDFYSTYQAIGTKREDVNIEYISQLNSGDMKESLTRYIKKDLITERTNYGVHKDDFKFLINASPIKKFGSQGQQKTFSIALKIAQFQLIKSKINVKPLLLLDDIFDKLDSKRIKKLLGLINENYFGQVFITDAGEERAKKLLQEAHIKATYFQVKNGVIQQEGE